MNSNDQSDSLVERTQQIVTQRMAGQQAGHGMDHVLRVLRTARELQAVEGGDRATIELAALLHDVGDAKFHDGVERSADFSREILGDLGAESDVVKHVASIVDNISFRKGYDSSLLSIEGKVVQDADRLDAIGAIGIVRTVEYGAAVDQPFHSSDPSVTRTGVAHFYEKMFKIKDLLNTPSAVEMAQQREAFMRSFLQQFYAEWGEPDPV